MKVSKMVSFGETVTWFLAIVFFSFSTCSDNEGFCDINQRDCTVPNTQRNRYLFYDVNPPEGFNLRRDVYMRYAIFARKLSKSRDEDLKRFKLVLPPWSYLFHWNYVDTPEHIPWSYFFDLESLQKFAPVIEMYQFFDEIGAKYTGVNIDEVYILQHYNDMFETGKFEDKMSIETCDNPHDVHFFHYGNITSKNVRCLSFHGMTSQLSGILRNSTARSVLFHHAEVALHDRFGDKIYWQCRRSMRFNKDLKRIADAFREIYLDSTDTLDNTTLPNDWTEEKRRRTAVGGPYLSVHLRRRDFLRGRPKEVPSIENAATQISSKLVELNLKTVFVATDAPNKEIDMLISLLKPAYKVLKYEPEESIRLKYRDGGIAIIDQIICSYARYFMGTHESTFSFRIQEEREILGFPLETTFNRLCGDSAEHCEKASVWQIV